MIKRTLSIGAKQGTTNIVLNQLILILWKSVLMQVLNHLDAYMENASSSQNSSSLMADSLTRAKLVSCGVPCTDHYPACESAEETIIHTMFYFESAQEIWN